MLLERNASRNLDKSGLAFATAHCLMAAPYRACIRYRSLDENCQGQEYQNSGRHDQSIMLGVPAHHGPQDLAQGLGRTSHAHNCGIDDEAVEFAKEIRRTQHGPPYHKLIDLSNETELKTRQRPLDQFHNAGRTSAVEPVCVEADRGLGIELLQEQEETQRGEAQHPKCAGDVLQRIWDEIHRVWKALVQESREYPDQNARDRSQAHGHEHVPGRLLAASTGIFAEEHVIRKFQARVQESPG